MNTTRASVRAGAPDRLVCVTVACHLGPVAHPRIPAHESRQRGRHLRARRRWSSTTAGVAAGGAAAGCAGLWALTTVPRNIIVARNGRAVIQSPPRLTRMVREKVCAKRAAISCTSMTLPTRPLGTSGLNLTTVGFGAWAAGGGGWSFGWGPQDDAASIAAMRHAIERGVNWIDTAAVYGLGHSEEVVGQFLRTLAPADRPYVFTKCGLEWDPQDRMKVSRRTLQPDSIRRECDASLQRLGVERIDLYQFHWPDEGGVPMEDSWDAMTRLVEQGKIRAAGVSNFSVELLERCEARRHVDSLQPPFSMIKREVAGAQLPWCAAHGTGVICYSPMQSGILTDTFSAARVDALRSRRLAAPRTGIQVAEPRTEPRPSRCIETHRGPASHDGRRGRHRVGPDVARSDRGDCRRAFCRAGRRMAAGGEPRAGRGRSRRHHQRAIERSGAGTGPAAKLVNR